jgi:hypothetical protein
MSHDGLPPITHIKQLLDQTTPVVANATYISMDSVYYPGVLEGLLNTGTSYVSFHLYGEKLGLHHYYWDQGQFVVNQDATVDVSIRGGTNYKHRMIAISYADETVVHEMRHLGINFTMNIINSYRVGHNARYILATITKGGCGIREFFFQPTDISDHREAYMPVSAAGRHAPELAIKYLNPDPDIVNDCNSLLATSRASETICIGAINSLIQNESLLQRYTATELRRNLDFIVPKFIAEFETSIRTFERVKLAYRELGIVTRNN